MVNKIFKQGLNIRGAVEYVIDQELHKGLATIMRGGNPDITKLLISSNHRKWKYSSGALSFTEKNLSVRKKNEIMDLFEETFLSGLEESITIPSSTLRFSFEISRCSEAISINTALASAQASRR